MDLHQRLAPVAGLLAFALSLGPACSRTADEPRRVMARELVLRRQIEDLQALVQAAESGQLLPPDKPVVAVSEEVVKGVSNLALPREQVLGGRFRVRLERLDVRFRDGHGSVRLDGRVSPADQAPEDIFAELAVFGLIDSVVVDPASGRLRGEVTPIGFEVQRVGVFGSTDTGRRLVERFAAQKIDDLKAATFPIDLPVQLEQALTLRGADDGPVRIRAARVPLRVSVAKVAAFGQRLWIALDVAAGEWTRLEETPSPAGTPASATGGRP